MYTEQQAKQQMSSIASAPIKRAFDCEAARQPLVEANAQALAALYERLNVLNMNTSAMADRVVGSRPEKAGDKRGLPPANGFLNAQCEVLGLCHEIVTEIEIQMHRLVSEGV